MLLNRSKSELEVSMETMLFSVDELPQVVESFSRSHTDISQGRLECLITNLNKLQGIAIKERFKEEDFKDSIFMTNEDVLSPYANTIGFYPFAVGFIFPNFEQIVAKLLHIPSNTRGFYVNKNFFMHRPLSDTGMVFVDGNELELTFMHYKELTSSSQFQYSKSHQLNHFSGSRQLRLAYELELALLREAISIYVLNIEFSRFQGISLESRWNGFWDSLKKEFYSNYLPTYKKMVGHLGSSISQGLEMELKQKIDTTFDLMKTLLHRDIRKVVDTFFRFGTLPDDMTRGKLYSPLNDIVTYFR